MRSASKVLTAAIVVGLLTGLQTGDALAKYRPPSTVAKMSIKFRPELYQLLVLELPPSLAKVFGAPLKCVEVKCRQPSD